MQEPKVAGSKETEHRPQPIYLSVAPTADGGSLDVAGLWRLFVNKKWIVVASVTFFVVCAAVYSYFAPDRYRAEVVLAPVSKDSQGGAMAGLGGLASIAGINIGANGSTAEAIALLESRKFIADFVLDKKLIPILFPESWDAGAQDWRSGIDKPDIQDAVAYFVEHVREVNRDTENGFVTLSVEWTDPEMAAGWATELVFRINETIRQRDIKAAQAKLDYLNDQLASAKLVEVKQAIAGIIEDQINAVMIARAESEYAFKTIDPAVVPKQRVWPQPVLIMIAAMGLGLLTGASIVLVSSFLKGESDA